MTEKIMLADASDTACIRAIMEECVRELPSREWFIDDGEDFIAAHMGQSNAGYTLKYLVGDVMAGYLIIHNPGLTPGNLGYHLSFTDEQLLRVRHLESACVLPAYRGRGIQQKLMAEAIRLLRTDRGVGYILCTVHPDNRFSRKNIEKQGLRAARQIEEHGNWPRLVMALDLQADSAGGLDYA